MLRGAGGSIAQVGAMLHPGYPAASFGWMTDGTGFVTAVPAVDLIYVYPFRVYNSLVISSIFSRTVTGGAGSAMKMAVWRNNRATARPTGLPILGQNAGWDTAVTGNDSTAIANIALSPGIWWGGSKVTGTPPTMVANLSLQTSLTGMISQGSIPTPPPNGFSVPDAYANDLMAFDMTAATFTPVSSLGIPAVGLGWN